ncbi:fimbrillin family protein [Paraprevotella clara]|uniref:fimbrillin family protein n=1 Tax=Paraprevotella clara TaxID=454154 RepID=UPI003AB577F7
MNRNRHLSAICLAAVLPLFAACTQDDPMGDNGTTLPEGVYPLEISSVTLSTEVGSQPRGADAPQTRVSENTLDRNSSKWDGDEVITVQLGDNQTTTYKVVDADGMLELTGKQLYWAKREDKVTAWYPTNGTIDLSGQSKKLAYVLQATAEKAAYDKPVALDFSHQLAKIRVVLKGEKAGDVKDVKIESYTSCTNTNGTVSTDGASIGEITMYKVDNQTYEANVVPEEEIKRFRVNDGEWVDLSNSVNPEKGKVHEITINAENKFILIGEEVKEYTVTKNKPVIIRGNATVKFKDYKVDKCYNGATIKIERGTPILIFEGMDNKIECGEAPILLAPSAGVTIKGNTGNAEDSQLIVRSGTGYPGIGSGYGTADNIPEACGNITIENITLQANGSFQGYSINSSAGIGTPGGYAGSCGDITIKNSIVHAQGGTGAAAIGFGNNLFRDISCGKITINNSKIYATVEYSSGGGFAYHDGYPACIGHGANTGNRDYTATLGEISITTGEDATEFFSNGRFKCTNGNTTGFYKAGKGTAEINTYEGAKSQVWSGVKFNSKPLATGNDDGYPSLSSASEKLR